jgi:hypothetical protein
MNISGLKSFLAVPCSTLLWYHQAFSQQASFYVQQLTLKMQELNLPLPELPRYDIEREGRFLPKPLPYSKRLVHLDEEQKKDIFKADGVSITSDTSEESDMEEDAIELKGFLTRREKEGKKQYLVQLSEEVYPAWSEKHMLSEKSSIAPSSAYSLLYATDWHL